MGMYRTNVEHALYTLYFFVLQSPLTLLCNLIRSFNDKPTKESAMGAMGKDLFEKEQEDLLADLTDIPKKACDRRVC